MTWRHKRRSIIELIEAANDEITKEEGMIAFSIKRHAETVKHTQSVTYLPSPKQEHRNFDSSASVQWNQIRAMDYIETLKKKGYNPGTKVTTKYGIAAVIKGFTGIGEKGISFFGRKYPCVIIIAPESAQEESCLPYAEDEITINT